MRSGAINADLFGKPLDEIEPADLRELRSVPEGWYVDYKESPISQRKIAKHLASFANQFGGWIFFGVQEQETRDKTDGRCAGNFPGLCGAEVAQLSERVRNAARDQVNPTPVYRLHELEGPCSEINLPADRSVVVIEIPPGDFPPYIESRGRIYRRVADSSDPEPETSRDAIDHLFQRSRDTERRLAQFFEKPEWLPDQLANPYISIFFLHDPTLRPPTRSQIGFAGFKSIMGSAETWAEIGYDSFSATSRGYVARFVGNNPADQLLLQYQYNADLSGVAHIPLNVSQIETIRDYALFECYSYIEEFAKKLPFNPRFRSFVVDCNIAFGNAVGAVSRFQRLLEAEGLNDGFYFRVFVGNALHSIPFFDIPEFLEFVLENGLPIGLEKEVFLPAGTGLDSLAYCEQGSSAELIGCEIFARVASVLGVPFEFFWDNGPHVERMEALINIGMEQSTG